MKKCLITSESDTYAGTNVDSLVYAIEMIYVRAQSHAC